MGKSLYDEETIFKNAVDTCAELLKSDLKLDIRDIIYPDEIQKKLEKKLKDTKYTQPASICYRICTFTIVDELGN